jgi:hypothetical protein
MLAEIQAFLISLVATLLLLRADTSIHMLLAGIS